MKLVLSNFEYHLLGDYNTKEDYDSRIQKGTPFYKDDLKDVVVASYSPASKVSRPVIASTNLDFGTEIALLDKAKIKVLINKVDVHKLAENFVSKDGSFTKTHLNQTTWGFTHNGFVAGYEKCLEINADKKFTLADMEEIYSAGVFHEGTKEGFNSAIQLINKSKEQTEWDVEVETEYHPKDSRQFSLKPHIKLTNGFITIISIK